MTDDAASRCAPSRAETAWKERATDTRAIALMRLVLVLLALTLIVVDPSELDAFVATTYAALAAYVVYAVVAFYVSAALDVRSILYRHGHWLDVAACTLLNSLSYGTRAIFFYGFLFAILAAAVRRGPREVLQTTVACMLLFFVSGQLLWSHSQTFELSLFVPRAVFLLTFGLVLARWGLSKEHHRRQLVTLGGVGPLCNPRFGPELTIGSVLERLRMLYDADSCALVSHDVATGLYRLRRIGRSDSAASCRYLELDRHVGVQLLTAPDGLLAAESMGLVRRWRFWLHAQVVAQVVREADLASALQLHLGAGPWLTVSVPDVPGVASRVFVLCPTSHCGDGDVEFLAILFQQLRPVVETIQLVERLIGSAVEDERKRYARDVHDVLIQPVVAIQATLAAIRRKWELGGDIRADVDAVNELATLGIAHLREYGETLTRDQAPARLGELSDSLHVLARTFGRATGMSIDVEAEERVALHPPLAREALKMVSEMLSNAWRHSASTSASLRFRTHPDRVVIETISAGPEADAPAFVPRTITERALALGGTSSIHRDLEGRTVVAVEVPL